MAAFSVSVYPQYQKASNFDSRTIKKQEVSPVHLVEQIPKRYIERYNRWKAIMLSVETGRELWEKYAENPAFRLTIIVSKDKKQGASVDGYQWANGKLVGMTVILGSQIDYGFPANFLYYPVLGSLAFVKEENDNSNGNDILAAAKFAHELGHIEHAAQSDIALFRLQNELSPIFGDRFLKNGHDSADPVLKEMAERMGGTPAQIKLEREIWAETYALRFLMERLESKRLSSLLKRVRQSIQPKFALYPTPLQVTWSDLTSVAGN